MRRSRALALTRAVWLLSMATVACSLDRRELSTASAGGGSESDPVGGAQAGADDPPPSGSSSGGGGSSPGLVDGCADLDTDGVADCESTLLENPSFAEDTASWSPSADAELSWDPRNALEDSPSGSAKLEVTSSRGSASQCVAVQGKRLVISYANAFVDDAAQLGRAEIQGSFFETEDCSGESVGSYETPTSTVRNAWTVVQAGTVSPDTTRSVSVALVALKPDGASELVVYFDNVMFKTKGL